MEMLHHAVSIGDVKIIAKASARIWNNIATQPYSEQIKLSTGTTTPLPHLQVDFKTLVHSMTNVIYLYEKWLYDDDNDDTGEMKGNKIKLSTPMMFKIETVQLLGGYDDDKDRLQNVRMRK
jgi:hypothetical protein